MAPRLTGQFETGSSRHLLGSLHADSDNEF